MTTLLLELFLCYLAISATVTFALVRFFRRTEEKAASAVLVEFRPRTSGPGSENETTAHRRAA